MTCDPIVMNATVTITTFGGDRHLREFSVDLRQPELDRFSLDQRSRHQVQQLISQALSAYDQSQDQDIHDDPCKTLLEIAFDMISKAVESEYKHRTDFS